MNRLVGLDVGDRTIGVAVADELGITAQGIGVVRRSSLAADMRALETMLAPYSPARFVVGLPLDMKGTVGPQAEKVKAFAVSLEAHFAVPVDTWDERLTTVAATRMLIDADMSREKRRRVVDKIAAVLILQGYMDCHAPVPPDPFA